MTIAIRYTKPVDVTLFDVTETCICGFTATGEGHDGAKRVREAFDRHECAFQRPPVIMCGCDDWLTCGHPWPAIFRA